MNSYRFTLRRHKAIADASIELNGITVLAGENGAGKSTITRWLYYLVEVITKYEWYAYMDLQRDIYMQLLDFRMALRDTRMSDNGIVAAILRWDNSSEFIDYSNDDAVGLMVQEARDVVERVGDYIQANIEQTPRPNNRLMRLMLYLEVENVNSFNRDEFVNKYLQRIDASYRDYSKKLSNRALEDLFDYIAEHYDQSIKRPSFMQFMEDRVSVLEKKTFGHLLGVQRAIYIDTPMAIGSNLSGNILWDNLSELLNKNNNAILSLEMKKMLYRIQHIIHGSVQLEKDDMNDDDLRYIREDNHLDIPLTEAATGIKSFAYIIRLLENGYLNKNTLLIIDEPEAHLHPQWVVEFARILVLLTKELGVRVLIASHNPDMVAAIQSIGKKEGLDNAITFYQAQLSREYPFEYEYKNLGLEVTEIFKSFNIAISRIQDYGRIDYK